MKQSFLDLPRPFVCALVMQNSMDETIAQMHNADFAGAQAIGVHMRRLPEADKRLERLQDMVRCTVRPVLAMHYRDVPDDGLSDDARAEYLLRAARAGASVVDVMGDFYDPSPLEYTRAREAVARQTRLIDKLHELGCAVIMSSHMQVSRTTEEALGQLKSFEARGADVVKIVPRVDSEEEMLEAVRTAMTLRRELEKPFIYVANGRYGRHLRAIAPMFGEMVSFGMYPAHATGPETAHSPIEVLRAIHMNLYEHMDTGR